MSTLQEFHNLADSPFFCTLAAKGFAHVSVVRCWIYRILICKWAAKKHAAPPVECGLAGRKMDFFRVRFHWEGMNVVLLGNCEKWKFRRFRMHKSKNSTSSSIWSFYWWNWIVFYVMNILIACTLVFSLSMCCHPIVLLWADVWWWNAKN